MHASNDLQTQFTSNGDNKILKFDFEGGLNASQSAPHPPTKKASVPDRSLEG